MGLAIGSITDYTSIRNQYPLRNIPQVTPEEVLEQEQALQVQELQETPQVDFRSKPSAKLEDISISFNRQDDFGYIGQDKDIRSLDVEKAIDDMKKDSILRQYQYFVGSSNGSILSSADGNVIPKY